MTHDEYKTIPDPVLLAIGKNLDHMEPDELREFTREVLRRFENSFTIWFSEDSEGRVSYMRAISSTTDDED